MLDDASLRMMAGLQHAPDFVQLEPETAMELAAVSTVVDFPPGHQFLRDDEASDGLYLIIQGFVEVTWRADNRRAPLRVELGPGGVVGEDSLGGTGTMGAKTVGAVKALTISAAAVRDIASRHPDFDQLVRRMVAIQGRRAWIVAALRRSPLFAHVTPTDLAALLPGSELIEAEADRLVFDGKEVLDGVAVVLAGDVILRPPGKLRIGNAYYQPRVVALGTGAVIGDTALVDDRPLLQDVYASGEGATLLRLTRAAFDRAFSTSAAFRRGVLSSPALKQRHRLGLLLSHVRNTDQGDDRLFHTLFADSPEVPTGVLTRWLAHAAAEEWGDRIAIITPDPGHRGPPAPGQPHELGDGWVTEITAPAVVPDVSPEAAIELLRADVVFLDTSKLSMEQSLAWARWVRRVIAVVTNPYVPMEVTLPDALGDRLPIYTAVVPAPPPEPGDVRIVPFSALRLHRDVVDAARAGRDLHALPDDVKAKVQRWMRGVTGRRLGVALGGGGALSWAEAAVLQRLHEAGVPVDMVAGVSGGAMVGAFYTAGMDQPLPADHPVPPELHDLPGLARLLAAGDDIEKASWLGLVSGWSMARLIEQHLPRVRLEDMDLPFYPVAVDADQAVQTTVRVGPLAYGTRASGAFPGTFTPATLDTRELQGRSRWALRQRSDVPNAEPRNRTFSRLVDGGLLNNIPDDTLFLEGAQLVLACNVIPSPRPRQETSSKLTLSIQQRLRTGSGPVARFWREFDPMVRLDDVFRAIYMLLFQPADWESRTADVKYQASTTGFAFTSWGQGDAIRRQALEGERGEVVDQVVEQVKTAHQSMRWIRDEDPSEELDALTAALVERAQRARQG